MEFNSLVVPVLTRRYFFIPLCLLTGHQLVLPFIDKSRACFASSFVASTTLAALVITEPFL